jgi:hypothetical protein
MTPSAAEGVSRSGPLPRGPRRERGAVLVHVAVAMMGLLAFSALSIDLGTLWVARGQAQNAADAAALAGGVSLAYIDETDLPAAQASAGIVAQAHAVWGSPVSPAEVTTAVGPCPAGAPGVAGTCMGVVVSRNAASGSPLPVFFARLFGAAGNEMHASASAKVMLGNRTTCPRPLAIADRWDDLRDETPDGGWTSDDRYEAYEATGVPLTGVTDRYRPADPASAGSGWMLAHIRPSPSLTFRLPVSDGAPITQLGADQLISIDLARAGGHEDAVYRYRENLESCSGEALAIGGTVASVYAHRAFYTVLPLMDLIASDAGASWDESAQAVRGSAFAVSPRLITIAVIDPDHYSQQDRSSGVARPTLQIRNLAGFFVEQVTEGAGEVLVRGRLARTAGMFTAEAPAIADEASFLRTVALVR